VIPWYSCYALHGHVRSILCKVTVWREHGYPCRSLTHVYLKLFIVVSTGCHFYVSDSQMCYSCTCVMTTVLLLFPCRESFVVSPRLLIYFSISLSMQGKLCGITLAPDLFQYFHLHRLVRPQCELQCNEASFCTLSNLY